MLKWGSRGQFIARLIISILLLPSVSAVEGKSKKHKEVPHGTPILWRAPQDISSRDLFLGPGGDRMKPDLRQITFIKEEKGGYSKKYRIRDASGHEWVAKVGKEAQSETAAVRLVWAAGYETEVNYLVPRLTIPGKGTFQNVRLEARSDSEKRLDEWKWTKNPFVGSREFQGLKVMMLLLANWDIKDSNNKIIAVKRTGNMRYIISDLGATFGKTGRFPFFWRFNRSRNNPKDYLKTKFVNDVDGNIVDFHYSGKKREIFDNITVDQARWIGDLLSRLSPEQIRDAFRAANYTPEQTRLLTQGVTNRINQLVNLPSRGELGQASTNSRQPLRRE
ncbi:MAG TPA: hypothetical protein VE977_01095 [Pyrinomonadaceae bacterium]|nr:hypothetical protein [Pyrinomonadaceae bacterium]